MVTAKSCAVQDKENMRTWIESPPDTESVAGFVAGKGIQKLALAFDIKKLRNAYADAVSELHSIGEAGIHLISVTRRPGVSVPTANDMSGRYYLRTDEDYVEEAREELVDEFAFTELVPSFEGTYFETVHRRLSELFPIGRMRILAKDSYNCNSWHRDPEPRLHIPIITNPGSLFIVNHHCTHLPADGSVYFTDTRGYHTALNGGDYQRVHLVAALPTKKIMTLNGLAASE